MFLGSKLEAKTEKKTVRFENCLGVHSFAMIRRRITDLRSLGSRCFKETEKSFPRVDLSVPLMHRDPSDLGSVILIRIIPKERTLDQHERKNRRKSAFSLYYSAKQLKCNLRILVFAPTKSPFHLLHFPLRRSLEAAFLVSRVTTLRLPQRRMMWRRRRPVEPKRVL